MIDFGKGNSTNDAEDSGDTIRNYQSSKKHTEEKKSRSSSFISSIDDEQKPLFSGIVDSPPGIGKATGLNFKEIVPTSGRIHIDKRSHSCKGNQVSRESGCLSLVLIIKRRFFTNNCTNTCFSNLLLFHNIFAKS